MDKPVLTDKQRKVLDVAMTEWQQNGSMSEPLSLVAFSAGLAEGRREPMEVLREFVACEDAFAGLLVLAPDMRRKEWRIYRERIAKNRVAARALCEKYK